jgi:hypothetical protein
MLRAYACPTGSVSRCRQRIISAAEDGERMRLDIEVLLGQLIGGDDTAPAAILDLAETSDSPRLLVAAALVSAKPQPYLTRAAHSASATRDRQLVALATAHLNKDADLLDALARDHLSDHPDSLLAAWIATQHPPTDLPQPEQP